MAFARAGSAAATARLNGSPSPNDRPPMTTTRPHNGRPRRNSASPITSGKASAWDERGRGPSSRPISPLRGSSTIRPGPNSDGGVDDDDTRVRRNGQQVVDVELADDPDPDVGRGVLADERGSGDRGAVVAAVGGAAHEDLDGRRHLHGGTNRTQGRQSVHHPRSTLTSRKWVAQLMHGS